MEVQSILAAKGTGVMTTRPGAKIGAVVRKIRLEKVGPTRSRRDSIRKVMAGMTQRRVRHLPVVEDSRPGGIGDVVTNRLEAVTLESNDRRDAYLATS